MRECPEKTCPKCGCTGSFGRDRTAKDGLSLLCRTCLRKEAVKRYRAKNAEAVAERVKTWIARNREQFQATRRTWVADNRSKTRTHAKAYAERHPEKILANNRKRRAALRGVETTLRALEWQETLEVFGGACAYCLRTGLPLTQDHIIPISRGGGHTQENVVPACRPCNTRKGDRPVWVTVGL
jgi:5-methylcytosine-specific restriction endonuclease McrA